MLLLQLVRDFSKQEGSLILTAVVSTAELLLRMANITDHLVIALENLQRDFGVPVATDFRDQVTEEKQAEDKAWQKKRRGRFLSGSGYGQAILGRTGLDTFETADTFGGTHSLSSGDMDGSWAGLFTFLAVYTGIRVTFDLEGAYECKYSE